MNGRQINYLHPSAELRERAAREQAAIDAREPKTLTVELPSAALIAFAADATERAAKAEARADKTGERDEYRQHWRERAAYWHAIVDTLDAALRAGGVRR